MKLQLTNTGTTLLNCIDKLKEINFIEEYSQGDILIMGLKDLVDEVRAVSFNSIEDVVEYELNNDLLIDCPLKTSYLIERGFYFNLLELV